MMLRGRQRSRVNRRDLTAGAALVALALLAIGLAPNPSAGTPRSKRPRTTASSLMNSTAVLLPGQNERWQDLERQIYIPGGRFRMGASARDIDYAVSLCQKGTLAEDCDASLFALERPSHMVTLAAFVIDATEVTVEDYFRCVDVGRCEVPKYSLGGARFEQPGLPVSFVTWPQARDYCLFRGARLPSEREWERAARSNGRQRFPWGNAWNPRLANHGRAGLVREDGSDGFIELAPVGSYLSGSSRAGVMDLAGNVSEWVADEFSEYLAGTVSHSAASPTSPSPRGVRRVIRGGDFVSPPHWLRSTARRGRLPDRFGADIGFRCARNAGNHSP